MRRRRVLLVEQNRDGTVGGSHAALLMLVQYLDRSQSEPVVAFYESQALVDAFRRHAQVGPRPASWRWPSRLSAAHGGPVEIVEEVYQGSRPHRHATGERLQRQPARRARAECVSVAMARAVLHVRDHVVARDHEVGVRWWVHSEKESHSKLTRVPPG